MTLNNLVGISIEKINIDEDTIKQLIAAAERNIIQEDAANFSDGVLITVIL